MILVGEHDKGTGRPFHESALSGRRLRKLVAELELDCQYQNAFDYRDGKRTEKVLAFDGGVVVVALGKQAEAELRRQNVECLYLPHPACRSKQQLDQLCRGLYLLSFVKPTGGGYFWKIPRLSDEHSGFALTVDDALNAISAVICKK